jgi:hypothetical protein
MRLIGKVVNTMPLEKPSRAVIQLAEWPFPIEIPMGALKYGQQVEIDIIPVKVRSAGVGMRLPPLSQPSEV